ncbi:MAG: hypothetical protein ACI89D_000629 [Bermanella sp.]
MISNSTPTVLSCAIPHLKIFPPGPSWITKNAALKLVLLEENNADKVPDWLKGAKESNSEKAEPEPKPEKQAQVQPEPAVDTILKDSTLALELVPIEGQEEQKSSDKPKSGRASFTLPDD